MRVGILTFHYALNYGAVFQAYALKKALSKLNYDSHIINFRPCSMRAAWDFAAYCNLIKYGTIKGVPSSPFKRILLFVFRRFNYIMFLIFRYNKLKRKYVLFEEFVNEYLCDDRRIIETPSELKLLKKYDVIVFGSDQIWNPNITKGFDPVYFGFGFCDNIRKVSYAASVGDLSIITCAEDKEKEFLKLLNNLDSISVRENNLCEFLKGKNIAAKCVIDPTLLLDREDYDNISSSCKVDGDYVFVYCLTYDKLLYQLAKEIALKNDYKIIAISGTKAGGKDTLNDISPCDFLSLLKNAQMVITNSFHGTVLSIIYNKEFYTILPPKRQDRIINLLNLFGLEERIISLSNYMKNRSQLDYTIINKQIEFIRENSIRFIKQNIRGN